MDKKNLDTSCDRNNAFTFQKLLRAYEDCRQLKRNTINCLSFEIELEKELLHLEKVLTNKTYKPGQSICFVVEKPKLREVFAATFGDRVVHHLLFNYLNPRIEPAFSASSYACRKGKGTHKAAFALHTASKKLRQASQSGAFYLKLDIQSFFVSINHDVLFSILQKSITNPQILWLTKIIIYTHPTVNYRRKGNLALFDQMPKHKSLFCVPQNQGLPIGNLTSQFFANVYLNELDQFIKRTLHVKHYVRYVDDFILLSADIQELAAWKVAIRQFLEDKLNLRLHPTKQVLGRTKDGIDFVGYIVYPSHLVPRKRVVKNLANQLHKFQSNTILNTQGGASASNSTVESAVLQNILSVVNSYYAHLSHSASFHIRQTLWLKHFGTLNQYIEPVNREIRSFRLIEKERLPFFLCPQPTSLLPASPPKDNPNTTAAPYEILNDQGARNARSSC